jgi:excisionase family DNA binding protein
VGEGVLAAACAGDRNVRLRQADRSRHWQYVDQVRDVRESRPPLLGRGDQLTRLLTTREVAERLALSPETILRRVRAGEIPAIRIATNALRFREEDVAEFLELRIERGRRSF